MYGQNRRKRTVFDSYNKVRDAYTHLITLPHILLEDWLVCCFNHITNDAEGNTRKENK